MQMVKKRDRQTVGQHVYKNLQSNPEAYDPIEMQKAMEKSTVATLAQAVEEGRKLWDHFYVVYLLRYENLLPGTLRGFFFTRQSRPDPDWDMSLWEHFTKEDKTLYHWTLPDKMTGLMMLSNPKGVPTDSSELLNNVQKFHKGELV